ncbi:hypothetical protein [Clostridium saccharobutylicum]|uniref:Uncharacterized protein n=1 Tax=Clostridium saccharobutylicum DSM 13864 TaxID=1345695 RepID=U5MTS3_CLOSA|nr:hypothetical protein [Clostridium saccharobutylicum]AGX43975.1 hypothetical protein CLSA_c30080 [Clostridium saccharobutylicum DSM 13864]AQR91272.1 hypothetical protein CLOSC_29960 [Clostridium saccharobutylicum]AQS01176.1 hypothetical protein CSACC_30030 [Clostridium saccharobutylicum]AQS15159.1 hypothetical protein CLOSACC_30030 [Clostridium saccharobutylicum]MBA2905286.1 hypothetical protein [Clostridium saccharobutylicum]
MEKFKELVELAANKNVRAEILIRNDRDRGWFVHLLFPIDSFNGEHEFKSLFKEYSHDLDALLNRLELFIHNTQF